MMNDETSPPATMHTCPACARPAQKLEAGVCHRCKASFDAQHRAVVVEGKPERNHVQTLADLHRPDVACDTGQAWIAPGVKVPVVDFDFSAVEEACNDIQSTRCDAKQLAGEAMAKIFSWCFLLHHKAEDGREIQVSLRTATLRFAAVIGGLRPDLLGRTFNEIGLECGVSKQAISKAALEFADAWGLKLSRSRPAASRDNMRRAMTTSHALRAAASRDTPPHV